MKQLVRLNKRPRRGGREFTYALRYTGEDGNEDVRALVIRISEKPKGNRPGRKRNSEWAMLSLAL
jgi:hypothetical protein